MENIINTQGKQPYQKPEIIEVIKLDNAPVLLSGSGGGKRPDYDPKPW